MGGGTCLADSLDWRGRGTPDRRDSLRASRLCRVRFCWWRASSPEYRWCIEGGARGPEVQKSRHRQAQTGRSVVSLVTDLSWMPPKGACMRAWKSTLPQDLRGLQGNGNAGMVRYGARRDRKSTRLNSSHL